MADSDPKNKAGYTTEIPDDILNEAVSSVEKRMEAAKSGESDEELPEDLDVEAEADSLDGIEIDIEDPEGESPEDEVTDPMAAASGGDAAVDEGDAQADEVSVEELIASGQVPAAVVEFLEAEQERARAAQERLLRTIAETENIRKRLGKQKEEALRFANQDLIKQLLPVLDNLILCLDNADTENPERLKEGVELTLRQWHKLFSNLGVEKIEAEVGTTFDPNIHEAVMQDPKAELPANTISKVLQTGFTYHERLLRPAMVIVATGDAAADASTEDAPEEAEEPAPAENPDAESGTPAPPVSEEPGQAPHGENSPPESEVSEDADPVAPDQPDEQNKTTDPATSENPLFGDDDVDDWADSVDSVRTDDAS